MNKLEKTYTGMCIFLTIIIGVIMIVKMKLMEEIEPFYLIFFLLGVYVVIYSLLKYAIVFLLKIITKMLIWIQN